MYRLAENYESILEIKNVDLEALTTQELLKWISKKPNRTHGCEYFSAPGAVISVALVSIYLALLVSSMQDAHIL